MACERVKPLGLETSHRVNEYTLLLVTFIVHDKKHSKFSSLQYEWNL